MDTISYIEEYLRTMGDLLLKVSKSEVEQAIGLLFDAWKREATVFVMGNGGSASTASHFASDLSKSTIVRDARRFKVISLTDNIPLVSAWVNDSGPASVFVEQLRPWLKQDDVIVGISVHGGSGTGNAGPWSQNLIMAVELARERGTKIIGLSGFGGGMLKRMADVCIVVPIDREPLGTPLVESVHVALHHLICSGLKLKIASYSNE